MAYYSAWIMFWNSDKMHSLTSNVFWKYVNYVLLCLKNAGIPFQFAIILFQGYHLINLYIWLPIPKLHLLWSAVINQLKLGSDKWNLKTAGGLLYLRVDLSWVLNNSISRKFLLYWIDQNVIIENFMYRSRNNTQISAHWFCIEKGEQKLLE